MPTVLRDRVHVRFPDDTIFPAYRIPGTWNGFDNVAVSQRTWKWLKRMAEANGQDPFVTEEDDEIRNTDSQYVDENGHRLVDLSNGYASEIVRVDAHARRGTRGVRTYERRALDRRHSDERLVREVAREG